jgi:chromosome segregation ATPase
MESRTPTILFLLVVTILMTAGCATTDDPRQGGLFSYNREAYQKRIAERQARYDVLAADTARQQQESKGLEETANQKRAEKEELTQKLARLDVDIEKTQEKIKQTKVGVKDLERRRSQLTARLESLKQQRSTIDAGSSAYGGEADKRVEIERLQREIDRLLKEAEALSRL